jgi:hypothetical protein
MYELYYHCFSELEKVTEMGREADRKKFVELAEKRVQRAIKDIRLIGNLSNRSNYSYTDEDARKIHRALKNAVDEVKARFDSKGDANEIEFKL